MSVHKLDDSCLNLLFALHNSIFLLKFVTNICLITFERHWKFSDRYMNKVFHWFFKNPFINRYNEVAKCSSEDKLRFWKVRGCPSIKNSFHKILYYNIWLEFLSYIFLPLFCNKNKSILSCLYNRKKFYSIFQNEKWHEKFLKVSKQFWVFKMIQNNVKNYSHLKNCKINETISILDVNKKADVSRKYLKQTTSFRKQTIIYSPIDFLYKTMKF